VIVIAFVAICRALPANSQSAPWTELDINDPPLAGSFSYNGSASPPTYTVVGSAVVASMAPINWHMQIQPQLPILKWRLG